MRKQILFLLLGLYLLLLSSFLFAQNHITQKNENWYAIASNFIPNANSLLTSFANFDGIHYLRIASFGYSNNAYFFPLYPGLIHILTIQPFSAQQLFSALLISNISLILAVFFLFKLFRKDYSASVSFLSIVALLIFPTSFFYASVYTESVFLLFTVLFFLAVRNKKWFLAGILGALMSITRVIGISSFFVLLFELYRNKKLNAVTVLYSFLSLLSLIAYSVYNKLAYNDFLYFIHTQNRLANGRSASFVFFPQTLYRYTKILLTVQFHNFEWWIAMLELSVFLFICWALYFTFKKKVNMSYLIFSAFCFLVPVSTGTFSSLPRYAVVLFPLFLTIGLLKNRVVNVLYYVICAVLHFICFAFFSRGYFIA